MTVEIVAGPTWIVIVEIVAGPTWIVIVEIVVGPTWIVIVEIVAGPNLNCDWVQLHLERAWVQWWNYARFYSGDELIQKF